MKRIALLTAALGAAAGAAYATRPDEFLQYAAVAAHAAERVWAGIQANPVPVGLAVGTFLLTVVYHKAKGKSLRESVEVAATRVTVVPLIARDTGQENPIVTRARARATRTQLIADRIGLENRTRKLPDELLRAEKETCYTEQALAEAERSWEAKQEAHDAALAKLEALRKEKAAAEAELAEIDTELKKLAEVV